MRYETLFHRSVLAAAAFSLAACASHESPPPPHHPNGPPPGGPRMAANGQRPTGQDGKPKPPPGGARMKPEEAMKRIDANHDGAVSYQEQLDFATHEADMRFSHLDANHDGRLTQAEVDAAEKQRESMKASNGHGIGNGGPAGQKPPPGGGLDSLLTRADTNHDGAVDQSENRAAAQQQVAKRFQFADKNGDGRLEQTEMKPPPRPLQQPGQ